MEDESEDKQSIAHTTTGHSGTSLAQAGMDGFHIHTYERGVNGCGYERGGRGGMNEYPRG